MRPHRSGLPVSERDVRVLDQLDTEEWVTPMQIGGRDGSHHSATLARLVKQGLVERRERGGVVKASYVYRLAPKVSP